MVLTTDGETPTIYRLIWGRESFLRSIAIECVVVQLLGAFATPQLILPPKTNSHITETDMVKTYISYLCEIGMVRPPS